MNRGLERLVGFARLLRAKGLPVGTERSLTFCRAATVLEPLDRERLYWGARATLVSSRNHLEVFDAAFDEYFGARAVEEMRGPEQQGPGEEHEDDGAGGSDPAPSGSSLPEEDGEIEDDEVSVPLVAGDVERLRRKSFDELSDEELARAAVLIQQLSLAVPHRQTRRKRASKKGRHLDVRRTLRRSLRTQGEPVRRSWKRRGTRARPLVLILDISGSMSAYSRALIQFGFAALAAGHEVEVFCFGTRLTRVTGSLRTRDPNRAIRDVADLVRDWEGGTRIGESLRELHRRYGQRGFLRGSIVVLCSDGLERGDPEALAVEMRRLARLSHRIVWVNPLKGSPSYEPLARGMAAALPHIDVFLSGHNVASLDELGGILAGRS